MASNHLIYNSKLGDPNRNTFPFVAIKYLYFIIPDIFFTLFISFIVYGTMGNEVEIVVTNCKTVYNLETQ